MSKQSDTNKQKGFGELDADTMPGGSKEDTSNQDIKSAWDFVSTNEGLDQEVDEK